MLVIIFGGRSVLQGADYRFGKGTPHWALHRQRLASHWALDRPKGWVELEVEQLALSEVSPTLLRKYQS